jgi:RNA polymerase sigma-70 factor, ECF subfamily
MDEPVQHPTAQPLLEPDAFRRFYDEALPAVYGYFFRRCGGRADVAEELTQQTFASAVAALRSGPPVVAPLPWVVTIARRRLVDHWRSEGATRRRLEAVRTSGDRVVADPDLPDPTIFAALDRVSPQHRTALVLRYADDLSVRRVGELIGKSERATESLLVRARAALADAYRDVDRG